jgi:hypothetical protein
MEIYKHFLMLFRGSEPFPKFCTLNIDDGARDRLSLEIESKMCLGWQELERMGFEIRDVSISIIATMPSGLPIGKYCILTNGG